MRGDVLSGHGIDPHVRIVDVTVDDGERRVLTNVSLSVARGELLVVVGENGAGKSTLVEIIAGVA